MKKILLIKIKKAEQQMLNFIQKYYRFWPYRNSIQYEYSDDDEIEI